MGNEASFTAASWQRQRRALACAGVMALVVGRPAAAAPPSRPPGGPAMRRKRSVALLAEDLRNGGVLGMAQGMREAAREADWHLHVVDAGGSREGRRRALRTAVDLQPDGFALCGSPADEFDATWREWHLPSRPVVGWHVSAQPGPMPQSSVATNVSTDPTEVGRAAAAAVHAAPQREAGVVIFTDSRFGIAVAKASAMRNALLAMPRTALLEVVDLPISTSAQDVPPVVRRLLHQYGKRWTDALAINDIYFDHAVPVLIALGVPADRLHLVSAGDGSASAFVRVRSGTYQTGTVAEPLNMQGWQMVDELNRLFAGQPVSRYVTPATLVTRELLAATAGGRLVFDPDNGYRDAYRTQWFGRPPSR